MQLLVNSEEYGWIETGADKKFFRKPDLFVAPSCFWAARNEENYDGRVYGVLASWRLRDSVAVLLEAKLTNLNDVIGQLIRGMQFLCSGDGGISLQRYGIALLSKEFYVVQFAGANVVAIEKCGWSESGGFALLKKALSHTKIGRGAWRERV